MNQGVALVGVRDKMKVNTTINELSLSLCVSDDDFNDTTQKTNLSACSIARRLFR